MRGYTILIVCVISLVLTEAQRSSSSSGQALECFCLPPNQICDPTQVVPRNGIRINKVVDTRILNNNPESLCDNHRIPCCFGVPGQPKFPGSGGGGSSSGIGGCGSSNALESRRVPGEADFGEYPWMALIVDSNDAFVATGALISPFHVITAAHKLPRHRNLLVRLGDYDIADQFDRRQHPVQTIGVGEVIFDPNFNSDNLQHDLAIIKLVRPAQYTSHIRPVCLPEKNQLFQGKKCWVTGWGKKGIDGSFQSIMKEVDLPIVDSLSCEKLLRTTKLTSHFILDKSFMCAGGEVGKDACEGDGGAPLVCNEGGRSVVVGLVSWGQSCGTHIPGVYVNIEHFRDFIDRYV